MPELPEVQTIVNGLNQVIRGEQIANTEIFYSGSIQGDVDSFQKNVEGKKVEDVRRKGKLLILDLDCEKHIVCHLKMTGQLLWEDKKSQKDLSDKYTKVIFELLSGNRLLFQDKRKFGYLVFLNTRELENWEFNAEMGVDALEVTVSDLQRLVKNKKVKIKPFLMDQKMIAGIGNIYADEVLYQAGINPCLRVSDLESAQLERLQDSMISVLNRAIEAQGSSFQEQFAVYGCSGQKCKCCGRKLKSVRISNRSSVYCPGCQPEPDY